MKQEVALSLRPLGRSLVNDLFAVAAFTQLKQAVPRQVPIGAFAGMSAGP